LCTSKFKNTVDYYRCRGRHVFVCFIDFSTVFDTVNYWKLFSKLLSDDVDYVHILAYWYSNQRYFVRLRSSLSSWFYLGNGTRQGSLLSPYLFAITDLISNVVDSGVGYKIADQILNILAYADDLVLLAPSWNAIQSLLSIFHAQATYIDMTTNI